jgi:hypothetical protein
MDSYTELEHQWLLSNTWFNAELSKLDSLFYKRILSPPFYISVPSLNFTPTLPTIDETEEDDYIIDMYYSHQDLH